jgi:hypothetical protein
VINVVGSGCGCGSSVGGVELPVPSHTAGPGIGYVVAVLAASLSMLKAIPGSVPVYAPGKATRRDDGGDAVPDPVTVSWAHSG